MKNRSLYLNRNSIRFLAAFAVALAAFWISVPGAQAGVAITAVEAGTAPGITLGELFACGVQLDGGVSCFGLNRDGELGNGLTDNTHTPVQVVGVDGTGLLTHVTQVSSGFFSSCAVLEDSTVVCWGLGTNGQLGNGKTARSLVPVKVVGTSGTGVLSGVTQVSVGHFSACAVLRTGGVDCWGLNDAGQLGNGSEKDSSIPVPVSDLTGTELLTNATQVSAGFSTTCALLDSGKVNCWGLNNDGQLGALGYSSSALPVEVRGEGGVGVLENVASISVGFFTTCALFTSGTMDCWGLNDFGQLGNGTTTNADFPTPVLGVSGLGQLTSIVSISTNGHETCAARKSGWAWCTGLGTSGQLGNNTTISTTTPVQVLDLLGRGNLGGVQQISVSFGNSVCAVVANSRVRCWGANNVGQIGVRGPSQTEVPVAVRGPQGVGLYSLATVPSAPLSATAVARSGAAEISFVPGNDGGSNVSTYTVSAVDLTKSSRGGQVVTGPASPLAVTGLTNGDRYVFTVFATSTVGAGDHATTNVVIPAGIPGPPSGLVAERGDGTATVRFAPAFTNGSGIKNYTLTAVDLDVVANGGQSVTGAKSPLTVVGLTNGDRYLFTVSATNDIGTSKTASSNTVKAVGQPSGPSSPLAIGVTAAVPPTAFTVTGFSPDSAITSPSMQAYISTQAQRVANSATSLIVHWSRPANPGRAPITSYRVTVTPSGKSCVARGATSCTVAGLQPHTAYRLSVIAENRLGTSFPSSALATTPKVSATFQGFTTVDGTSGVNLSLGLARAQAVALAFSSSIRSISGAAITTSFIPGGATNFVDGSGYSPANRRVIVRVSSTGPLPRS